MYFNIFQNPVLGNLSGTIAGKTIRLTWLAQMEAVEWIQNDTEIPDWINISENIGIISMCSNSKNIPKMLIWGLQMWYQKTRPKLLSLNYTSFTKQSFHKAVLEIAL